MSRLLLFAFVLIATPAVAQDAITPGNPDVDSAMIATGEMNYSITVKQGPNEQPFGTVAMTRTVDPEEAWVTEIRAYDMMGQKFADTTVAVWPSLAAISHFSRSPQRTLRYTVEDGMISGTRTVPGEDSESFEMSVEGPVFDSSWMSTLATALPLARGYEATIAAFEDEEAGYGDFSLATSGPTEIELPNGVKHEVWEVSSTNPAGEVVKYFIDTNNRALLRIVFAPQPGVEVFISADLPSSGK